MSTDDRRGPDVFSFWGIVAQGHTAEEARAVIYEEIDFETVYPVTAFEVEEPS